jgi:hypothetical protein
MRLGVDLRGNGALSDAMLTHDQDRAVAFGNAGNRALNLRLNRGKLPCGTNGFVCRFTLWMVELLP